MSMSADKSRDSRSYPHHAEIRGSVNNALPTTEPLSAAKRVPVRHRHAFPRASRRPARIMPALSRKNQETAGMKPPISRWLKNVHSILILGRSYVPLPPHLLWRSFL